MHVGLKYRQNINWLFPVWSSVNALQGVFLHVFLPVAFGRYTNTCRLPLNLKCHTPLHQEQRLNLQEGEKKTVKRVENMHTHFPIEDLMKSQITALSRLPRRGLEEVPLLILLFICSSNVFPCAYTVSLSNDLHSASQPSAPINAIANIAAPVANS